jgi:predicted RNase H-like nuclease (RuvC/YqgF family)
MGIIMNQEKFVNAYIELLNTTLTEAIQKNIVFQVQKKVTEEEVLQLQQTIEGLRTEKKLTEDKMTQAISSMKNELNDARSQSSIAIRDRDETRKASQHLETFKSELIKARAEIEELKNQISAMVATKVAKKKVAPLSTNEETVKDAGNF